MRFFTLFFLGLALLFSTNIWGQDTITLLNGKTVTAEVLNADSLSITYNFKKKRKTVKKTISSEIVFDILYADGHIDTIYYPNPDIDQYLSVENMHLFILGEQDASEYYKTTLTSVFGVVFGIGGGYILSNRIYVAAVPLIYTVGAGVSTIKMKGLGARSSSILSHPAYQEGYIKTARSKKAFAALGSSLVGTLVGIGIANAQ
jgi:hypothetical protein